MKTWILRSFLMISAAAFGPRQAEQDWNNSAGSCFIVLQKAASSLGIYTEEGRHVTSIPVGRHPHEMVVSPDGRYVFTTNNGTMRIEQAGEGGNTVSIIDLKARRRVREVSLGKYHRPHGIDFDPRAGQIFVTCENPDRLLIIDPETRSVIQDYETGGQTSHLVTLSRDGKKPYVSNSRSDNLSAIDLQSRAIKLVRTGARPEGSVLSKDGTRLYVVNRDSNTISVIHTGRDEKIGEIGTGQGPVRIGISGDGRQLVYALYGDKKVGIAEIATSSPSPIEKSCGSLKSRKARGLIRC